MLKSYVNNYIVLCSECSVGIMLSFYGNGVTLVSSQLLRQRVSVIIFKACMALRPFNT